MSVAAFETQGYRPRDEDVYVIYSEPGQMVGASRCMTIVRFSCSSSPMKRCVADDARSRRRRRRCCAQRFGGGEWECAHILDRARRCAGPLFRSRRPDQNGCAGRAAASRWSATRRSACRLLAGQGSALAMTAAYVLAGELARAAGRHEEAFGATRRSCGAYRLQAKGRRAFLRRLCAEDPVWTCSCAIRW